MGIYVDQIGYETKGQKLAMSTSKGSIFVVDAKTGAKVYEASMQGPVLDPLSEEQVWAVDISGLEIPGKYKLVSEDGSESDSFMIGEGLYKDLQKALAKCLYYQRCGCALLKEHAGIFTHAKCHCNEVITLDDYLSKKPNPDKYIINGGWHDAGDFGRYSTAGAVALGHILYAYELFADSMQGELNIPETGNGVPDILNECRYELDWLIKMQTPDGGVYHKLTAFNHAPFIMPEEDKDQFMLYPVSSMAVADYVAVMALASRVYQKYDPEFSQRALSAARKSFGWLENNGYVGFRNPEGSNTGWYGDPDDRDERLWAAAEILRTDKEGNTEAYRKMLNDCLAEDLGKTDFGWTDVSGFVLLTLLTDQNHCAGAKIEENLRKILFDKADEFLGIMKSNGYCLAMEKEDFVWGSNMVLLNRAMLLSLASLLSEDKDKKAQYRSAVSEQMHYLLGRNALNRSYVTGFGEHAFKNPHNRPTAMDGIDEVMPGWVSGGPFTHFCDPDAMAILKKGTAPMKCHADVVGSYSTNEITIYWNSPAIFVTAFLNGNY